MRRLNSLAAVVLVTLFVAADLGWAQGGAGATGTITGKVYDESGAVLPGVAVTATSPAQMGTRTDVTDGEGIYRFPGVPAGTYMLKFQLAGFRTVTRDHIVVTIGFTAAVDEKLGVQALEETVTVSGESPVIDTAETRVQTAFTADMLASIPNARDMWSLLAATPSVTVARVDVGGSTAGTQTQYFSYGYTGQNRPLIEGINTTEGTSAAGFYLDYGSFEEVFIGAAGNSAEMPVPGVLTQFVGKSGGNKFAVNLYYDFETEDLQATNLTPEQVKPSPTLANAFPDEKANRLSSYYNLNIGVGGPVVVDKLWFFGAYFRQRNEVAQPASGVILDGTPFPTLLFNYTGKVTYSLTAHNKIIGYIQHGTKQQPFRTDAVIGNPRHLTKDSTLNQNSPSWVFKGEYNRTVGSTGFLEVRAGQFGYNFGLLNNIDAPRYEDEVTLDVTGGGRDWELIRRRNQVTGAYSWFKDNIAGGNHNFKFGGEWLDETGKTIWNQGYHQEVVHFLNNGVPAAVRLYSTPSAAQNGLQTISAFVTDTWTLQRLTTTVGARYDRYRVYLPEQEHAAGRFFPTAVTFAAVDDVISFNHLVPRIGAVYDLTGDGKTVVKGNFGRFYFNPGVNLADSINPNTADQFSRWSWDDRNNNRLYDPGEEVTLTQRFGGVANAAVDPDLKNSYADEFSTWFERELIPNLGARVGFVWKKDSDGYQQFNTNRPFDQYNIPITVPDPGPNNVPGFGTIQAFNLNPALLTVPSSNVTMNFNGYEGTYKTIEFGANKRWSNRWSLVASFSYVWTDEFQRTYAGNSFASTSANASLAAYSATAGTFGNNPNDNVHHEFTTWNVKVHGTVEPAWGLRFTPIVKHGSGVPYGRILLANLNYGNNQPILVEPIGTRRQEDITLMDMRVEKQIRLFEQARIGLFFDLFNIFNANPALNINWTTGPRFEFPTTVLPPRIAKFGIKFDF
jgi:Carboxypeptidase regulatory-like domain